MLAVAYSQVIARLVRCFLVSLQIAACWREAGLDRKHRRSSPIVILQAGVSGS